MKLNKYQSALKQMCLQCKTKNCKPEKCNRFTALSELVTQTNKHKTEWKKSHIRFYITLFKYRDKGILQEFLDNEETILTYLESVGE